MSRRPGKKIGNKYVEIDGGRRAYTAELRYSQDTKLFYAYYNDEAVQGETEAELRPLLKALIEKHELLEFEVFIEVEVSGYVHEDGPFGGGTGTGSEVLDLESQLYQLTVDYRLWAVAVNEVAAGVTNVHIKRAWETEDGIKMDTRIGEINRGDLHNWVKYTPERLATLDQVRRGMVQLHNRLVGIFGKSDSASKFLDAPRGLLLLGKSDK